MRTLAPSNAHRAAALCIAMLIAGCASTPPPAPVYVASPLPPVPAECKGPWPAEPKLSSAGDASDIDAAKDRGALKDYGRGERQARRVCLERLKTLGLK